MAMLNLLVDPTPSLESLVETTATGEKKYYIEGYFLQSEVKNRNGRIYPKDVMEKAVDRYLIEYVNPKRAIGEFIHPTYPLPNPKEAALIVESLSWEGNNVYGKALILDNPQGNQIKALIKGGFKGGVSSRGLGSISNRNGTAFVNDDYVINAIDYVDMPSGQVCYVNGLTESKWAINESGLWVEHKPINSDELLKGFKNVLSNIYK